MSQLRQNVHGQRRISTLLFSLLRQVNGRLDGWFKRHQALRVSKHVQTEHRSTLHFERLEPRLLLSADLVAGSLSHDAFTPVVPGESLGALFEDYNQQSVASPPITVESVAVGQLPGRSPVPSLDLSDTDGTHFTLAIAGPGVARLDPDGAGYQLSVSGNDASTRIDLTGSGGDGRITLAGVTTDNALGTVFAPVASLTGSASFTTLNTLSLGDTATGASLEGNSLATLNVSGDALGDLRLSGRGVSGFVLGSVQTGGAIGGLWSISGRANSINAQSTGADWRASISNPLTQLVVRGDASGQLATPALQIVQIGGSVKGMTLRIGASLGSDAALGGSGSSADQFGAGTLARLRVSGDIDDSQIVIGGDPRNGRDFDGDDRQLGSTTNRVQELLVGGQLKGNTHIIAPAFPTSVRINGVVGSPAGVSQLATRPT